MAIQSVKRWQKLKKSLTTKDTKEHKEAKVIVGQNIQNRKPLKRRGTEEAEGKDLLAKSAVSFFFAPLSRLQRLVKSSFVFLRVLCG